jgi:hypothetical protein
MNRVVINFLPLIFAMGIVSCTNPIEAELASQPQISPAFQTILNSVDKIKTEQPALPRPYVVRAVHVVGIYNRMLSSPRFLMPSVQQEAQSAFYVLRASFPSIQGSITDQVLERLNRQSREVLAADGHLRTLQARYSYGREVMQAARELDRTVAEMVMLLDRINLYLR